MPYDPSLKLYFPMNSLDANNNISNQAFDNSLPIVSAGSSTPIVLADPSTSISNAAVKSGVTLVSDLTFGHCLKFDGGANSYIQLLPAMNFDYSSGITIEAWVWYDQFANWSRIVDFGINRSDNIILANTATSSNLILKILRGTSEKSIEVPKILAPSTWIHLAITVDSAGTARLYKNGDQIGEKIEVGLPNTILRTTNYIGKSNWSDENFKGKMAHLRLYNRALGQAEIANDRRKDLLDLKLYFPMNSKVNNTILNLAVDSPIASADVKSGVTMVNDPTFGQCMKFDGTANAYIQLPAMNFDYSRGLTIEAWVWYDQFASWSRIIDFGNGGPSDNIILVNRETTSTLGLYIYRAAIAKLVETPGALVTGTWIHLAATVDGAGAARLYKNGVQIGSVASVDLPNTISRAKNYIGKSNWSHDPNFKGRIAHLRLYTRALSQLEISNDMNSDKLPTFRTSHPLAFSLYDPDGHYALYINSNPAQMPLTLELNNVSAQTINLLRPNGDTVSATNYHFQLNFRPGTLSQPSIDQYKTASAAIAGWSILSKTEPTSGQVTLYLLYTQSNTLPVGSKLLLNLPLSAAAGAGARGTQVEMLPNPDQVKYASDGSKISGSQLSHLQIINHQGLRDIPLHVGFVGSNRVLNDNSLNSLTLEIRNQMNRDDRGGGVIMLDPRTQLSLSVDISDDQSNPWALTGTDRTGGIHLSLSVTDSSILTDGNWTITSPSGTAQAGDLTWTIIPTATKAILEPGESLKLYLSGIQTNKPSGLTNLTLRYENIPGYWDGQFTCAIEKAPLVFSSNNKVGIGVANPAIKLAIGDSDTGLQQQGENILAFYTNNLERVRLDPNGNVGIGVMHPKALLHVGKNVPGGMGGVLRISNPGSSGTNSKVALEFTTYDVGANDAVGRILVTDADRYSANIEFQTKKPGASADNSLVTRLKITGDGNVGIGTDTSPTEKLEVDGRIKDQTGYVMPVGAIIAYGGSIAPAGWLMCDGLTNIASDPKYADLRAVLGMNANWTPNLCGRTPIGAGSNLQNTNSRSVEGETANIPAGLSLNNTGGEWNHQLSVVELPDHSHKSNEGFLQINGGQNRNYQFPRNVSSGEQFGKFYQTDGVVATDGAVTQTGQSHNNMPPYYVINYIIKY